MSLPCGYLIFTFSCIKYFKNISMEIFLLELQSLILVLIQDLVLIEEHLKLEAVLLHALKLKKKKKMQHLPGDSKKIFIFLLNQHSFFKVFI